MKRPQIVREDAVGERRNDDADSVGARRGKGARELVGDVGEVAHRALDAMAERRRDQFGLAQDARRGDRADAGKLGNVEKSRASPPRPFPAYPIGHRHQSLSSAFRRRLPFGFAAPVKRAAQTCAKIRTSLLTALSSHLIP